ncbi:MAG: TetR/AcrR family transcriptional regulator [Myxococcota bacterium]|nr:TetR/AcrR family transcriptional regulator [Myxococcota bacterium]
MPRAAASRPDRRREIARALYACMRQQGYARTTLKDIAARAGMSPSHVGYYFENQAAILEYYGERVCEQNLGALPDLDAGDFEALLERIAAFCFEAGQTSPGLLRVIQELTGLAVHDPRLRAIKSRHTVAWRGYLEELFRRAPRLRLPAREAALQAHALLVGLNTNAVFDDALDRARAHALFHRELRALAGLAPRRPTHGVPRRSPTRRRGGARRKDGR